jgi:CRP-like cAMP-binding protein
MSTNQQTIRGLPFFASLPDVAIAAIAAIAIELHRPAGATLFLEGDPAPGLCVVLNGHVKVSRTSAAGREQVLTVVRAGSHFNSVPTFDNGPCPADAHTLSESTLLLLPTAALHAVALQHPQVALALLAECGGFLRRLVLLVDDLALHTVQGRLARLLLTQAAAAEAGSLALTQAEMAAHIGTVREMISRTLRTFEALGLIQIDRGAITVLDAAGLEMQIDG